MINFFKGFSDFADTFNRMYNTNDYVRNNNINNFCRDFSKFANSLNNSNMFSTFESHVTDERDLDRFSDDKKIYFKYNLAGYSKEDVKLTSEEVENCVIFNIEASKSDKYFGEMRSVINFEVSKNEKIDLDSCNASMENGILIIAFDKTNDTDKIEENKKTIEIK